MADDTSGQSSSSEDNRVMYPSPQNLTFLNTDERFAWFVDEFMPPDTALFSQAWRDVVEAVGVHDFDLNYAPPYQAWVLRDTSKLIKLFSNFSNDAVQFILAMGNTKPRQIVVCEAGAHPFGKYFYRMVCRNPRFVALLIMLYGHRNAAPCSCCARRYAATCCPYIKSDGETRFAHINYPFLYCISHPALASGTCANCFYHVESNCEYNKKHGTFNQFDCIKAHAATATGTPGEIKPREFENAKLCAAIDWRQERRKDSERQKEKQIAQKSKK